MRRRKIITTYTFYIYYLAVEHQSLECIDILREIFFSNHRNSFLKLLDFFPPYSAVSYSVPIRPILLFANDIIRMYKYDTYNILKFMTIHCLLNNSVALWLRENLYIIYLPKYQIQYKCTVIRACVQQKKNSKRITARLII